MQAENQIKPTYPIRRKLNICWVSWLIYRLSIIAILSHLLLTTKPSITGGIFWQGIWLIPALISTPFIMKGKSPYALLIINMVMMVYLGGSGMAILKYGLTNFWQLVIVWTIDFILLILINYWLFILLKRLPKMNR